MRHLLGILAIATFGLASVAHASSHCASLLDGEVGCACALSLDDFDPATTAILSDIVGNVEITTPNQYSPADPAIPLDVGDRVVVFEDSSAFLTFGPTCSRELPEQSSLVIRNVEDCACAALVEARRQAAGDGLLLGGLGLGALGVGIYFLVEDDDDDRNPPPPVTPE